MTNLSTIRNSFDAAARSYDQRDGVQPEVVRRLSELLPEKLTPIEGEHERERNPQEGGCPARILEVGCGTGALTEVLCSCYPQAHLTALDLAPAMVAAARRRMEERFGAESANTVEWYAADVRAFEPAEPFELIASSSALHWVRPLPEVFTRLAGWLRPGGELVCALMTTGTLAELREVRRLVAPHKSEAAHELPDGQAAASAAFHAGLQVRQASEREVQVRMRSALDLMRMLAAQGTAAGFYGSGAALNRTELARLLHEYDRAHATPGGGVLATWRVLYLQAMKPCRGDAILASPRTPLESGIATG